MASSIEVEWRHEKIIRGLLKLPGNRRCINCNSLGPQYVCTNFWTFVCTTCSGVHRELQHRVKSVSMHKFTAQEIIALQKGGNEHARQVFFKQWDPQHNAFPDNSNYHNLITFIKHVYVDQRYTGETNTERLLMEKDEKEEFSENSRSGGTGELQAVQSSRELFPQTFGGNSSSSEYSVEKERQSNGRTSLLQQSYQAVRMEETRIEFNMLERKVDGSQNPSNIKLPFLKFITGNFSNELKIGNGGCGVVYKGILPNRIIAVKRLSNSHIIDDKMFHREVKAMMKVDHKNVVQFLAYCSHTEEQALEFNGQIIMAEVRERLLCFEYISNGNLENYITDELRGLEWETRYQIIKGICNGLYHLHMENHIIHMDLKPANILLDNDMVAKITDFGLSRPDDRSQTMSSERFFSLGYCAPEYLHHGKMSAKSDIYSLGIIIIELLTGSKGKPNISKVYRRWKHRWNKSGKDARLWYKQVAICLDLARRCTHEEPADRPDISDIISDLNKVDSSDVSMSDATEYQELEDMLGIKPLEIHLPFEFNKQTSCPIELTNDTDYHFAFKISTTSLRPYCIRANNGTLPPRSKCGVTITLQAQEKSLPDDRCRDEFCLQSTRIDGSLTPADIGGGIFREEPGRVVDKVNFTIILKEASPSGNDS